MSENVQLDKCLGFELPPVPFTYTQRDVMLYALGIGAAATNPVDEKELNFTYEGADEFQVFPSFGVIVPNGVLMGMMEIPGLKFDIMKLLHGEQYLEILKPLPEEGTLHSYAKVAHVYDKGKGALLILEVTTQDEEGTKYLFNQYSLFLRGIGGFGGDKGPRGPQFRLPSRPADKTFTETTTKNQALLYRLSGDTNPLHADPDMAALGGFDRPILHGLCSFGFATRAIVKEFADNDGDRLKSIQVRFSRSVYPGDTLKTEMWDMGNNKILFRTRAISPDGDRDDVVLSNCMAELYPIQSSL